jgi:O-antigen/teichoic acid export membrane protein
LEKISKERSLASAVIGGTGLIAAAGGINKIFSLVTAPILTRILGPSPYGVVALLGTVTSLATTISLLGVDLSYSRFFFSGAGEEGPRVERFCWRFAIGSACIISLAAGWAWWVGSDRLAMSGGFALMIVIGVFLAVLNVMATTRQRLRGAYSRIAASIVGTGAVAAVLSVLLALFWRRDAWTLLLGTAGGVIAGIAIAGLPPIRILREGSGYPRSYRWEILRLGLAGAVTAPMFWLMNSTDRWFIGMWLGPGPLGVYSFASSMGTIGILVNSAITLTWYPEMSRAYETSEQEARVQIGRLWARRAGGLLIVWLAVAAAGGDAIRLLTDSRFHQGVPYVPWIAGGIFFYGIFGIANTGLILKKNLAPAVGWWILGAAVNAGLNFLLVGRVGALGAAVAFSAGFALIAAGVMRSAQARFHLPVPWVTLGVASGLTLIAGIAMAAPWSESAVKSLCLKFPVGVACALAVMYIVAPDWVRRFLSGEFLRRAFREGPSDRD